jgi:heparan-alpha-glucosaminide N-acetyltransferase
MHNLKAAAVRLDSIDIFRAVTMFLMIFVNDLWSLEQVPRWLEHSEAEADGMGLSDAVFPVFLFIVGLSIPFAISNRLSKGDGYKTILEHIAERTSALLLMGIFIVNFENIYSEGMVIGKYTWEILMITSFFLIWNVYPGKPEHKNLYTGLKTLGYLLLAGLAAIYKGGDAKNTVWIQTHWYGILGLIGWSYLLCAIAYLFCKNSPARVVVVWLFFLLFNLADFAGLLGFLEGVRKYVWIVGSGAMPAFTMAGVTASVIYRIYGKKEKPYLFLFVLILLGALSLVYGLGARPFWGISKIRATPAWVGICTGIGFVTYAFFYWLVDLKHFKKWASLLQPAGNATLTCYLVPYVWYAVITIAGISLPLFLRTGMIGLIKSLLFSFLVILVTGKLGRSGVRLKI